MQLACDLPLTSLDRDTIGVGAAEVATASPPTAAATPPMKRARDQDGALESQRIRDHWKVGAKGLWAHFIDGKERYCESNVGRAGGLAAEVSGALQLRSPFDGTPVCMVSMGEKADVDRAVAAAAAAHADGRWSGLPARQRARVLLKAASLLADNLGWLAEAESRQTGRCLREMRAPTSAAISA